jgi:hypothetical protein
MKRFILIIVVLLLIFDLADDGCLGKAIYIPPHSSAKASFVSPHPENSGNLDSWNGLALSSLQGPPSRSRSLPVTHRIRQTLTSDYYYAAGSGGIPL